MEKGGIEVMRRHGFLFCLFLETAKGKGQESVYLQLFLPANEKEVKHIYGNGRQKGGVFVKRIRIDMETFLKELKKVKSASLKQVALPKGLTRGQLATFLRIMEAKDLGEIKDISPKEVAELYVLTEKILSVFSDESVLTSPDTLRSELQKAKAMRSGRRIL